MQRHARLGSRRANTRAIEPPTMQSIPALHADMYRRVWANLPDPQV